MQKQRNAVEKSLGELSESIKTVVTQRLYAALAEVKVERTASHKVLAVVLAAIDETTGRASRPFDKAVDELVAAVQENSRPKDKSGK
jgi:hypothetical protein